ncbi:proline---tRNA ligase [Synchytrium microbalum]|uniref:Proline---tRNA ligase n=1 Tax=Synchytrium microbalum TaxID=1806994 RepID=A0A507CCT7_9FUNG|nr:proline---tRNA ligase [Synchytrium microbalum]TPX37158.1 proline---tRNA ligase [Synchytrium microbalum]
MLKLYGTKRNICPVIFRYVTLQASPHTTGMSPKTPWTNSWGSPSSSHGEAHGISSSSGTSASQIRSRIDALVTELSNIYEHPKVLKPFMTDWLERAAAEKLPADTPEGVKYVEQGCVSLGVRSEARFYHVESDYYDWSLQRRCIRLQAPSISHLCKSVIMENTHHNPTGDTLDPTNSKYYCVIVQYVAKLNTQKLINFVYTMNKSSSKPSSKRDFNLRVADEALTMTMTGHEQNGVSPIGMKTALPIILSESITKLQPPVLFLGGGHVDWKLALPVQDFIDKTRCFVVDTS